jgi:hypothetical protein
MQTRRMAVISLAGSVAAVGMGFFAGAEGDSRPAGGAAAPADGRPNPTIIAGRPTVLDYGGGLKVPCNRDAFYTLWEGETFWLTFGFGFSQSPQYAQSLASHQAVNLMQFMLLTLTFAPNRLVKSATMGWRKKNPTARDFVIGDLPLPGAPMKSVVDNFLGRGTIDMGEMWRRDSDTGMPLNMRQIEQNAFTSYFVLKKDMSLDDVRKRARLIQI